MRFHEETSVGLTHGRRTFTSAVHSYIHSRLMQLSCTPALGTIPDEKRKKEKDGEG